jgi:hypothetical protein
MRMSILQLRREDQLLICVARPSLSAITAAKLRALLGDGMLDWDYVLAEAERHGVANLLWRHLQSAAEECVPPTILARLQTENQRNTERCLWLAGELAKIVTTIQQAGIPCIQFKGPTLAMVAYGDLGLRQFADLDLFVRAEDFAGVRNVIAKHGFMPPRELGRDREAALLRFDNAFTFEKDADVFLDVHWRFAPASFAFRLETEDLWRRLKPVKIGSQTLFTLSPEDLLMVLCCHGFTHQWERLGWICDVATLVERRKDLDWDYLFETARRLGVLRIVLLGLFLATEVLGAGLPSPAQERLQNEKAVRNAGEETATRLFAPRTNRTGLLHAVGQQLRMRERRRDRIRSLLAVFVMPRDYDLTFVSVPAPLSILYYLVRPIRWGAQRVRNLLRRESEPTY